MAPSPTTVPSATPAAVLARSDRVVIDLRSPAEFADDHLPGAVNVPLFDDAERALVGTLWGRVDPEAAFGAARGIAAGKVEALLETIAQVAGWEGLAGSGSGLPARLLERTAAGIAGLEEELVLEPAAAEAGPSPVYLHCWRGGLRSRSVAAFVQEVGLGRPCVVSGGYKAYRRLVRAELEAWSAPPVAVLRGLTGVGKTLVLGEIERLRPGWTVDLEALAGHRSSILGMVGLEPTSQKGFESGLAGRLRAGFGGPAVFEGESRKVGDSIIPPRVWEAMCGGSSVELEAPLERRVEVLMAEYLTGPEARLELRERLPFIEERLGSRKWAGGLTSLLDEGCEDELVRVLLDRYYDPLYRHSEKSRPPGPRVDARDPARAAAEIVAWLEARPEGSDIAPQEGEALPGLGA